MPLIQEYAGSKVRNAILYLVQGRSVIHGFVILCFFTAACSNEKTARNNTPAGVHCVVLGITQDGGHPQAGCMKKCCTEAFADPQLGHRRACLAIQDDRTNKVWLIEATPDLGSQMHEACAGYPGKSAADAIFVTHSHVGHYTGLMYFGRETMNQKLMPVYVMPRMKTFLEQNGPWSQLVSLENIQLVEMQENTPVRLADGLSVTPLLVQHRGEYAETAGFRVAGPHKKLLFIPDIDKWERWERKLADELAVVDYAFIDGTFYDGSEIGGRDFREVPHPFIIETMTLLDSLPLKEREKVIFIHFNHTNPVMTGGEKYRREVTGRGYHIASEGQDLDL